MSGSNSVAMVILNLEATAAKECMFARDFLSKKLQKVTILELWCGHSLGVHHLCMPLFPLLHHRVGCSGQDYCF